MLRISALASTAKIRKVLLTVTAMSVDPPANEQPKVSDPGKPERRCAGAAQHDAGANGVWMPGSVAAIW